MIKKTITIDLPDHAATKKLAACLAVHLHCGDFLALCGDLGAGKTALTHAILAEWGIDDVTSPTFTLHHSYEGLYLVHHLDLYRLQSEQQVHELGWFELTEGFAVVIAEWMDKFPDLYPKNYLQIKLLYAATEGLDSLLNSARTAEITAEDTKWEELFKELKYVCSS